MTSTEAVIGIAMLCLFVGFIAGGVTLAVLGSSANADRDCYWQEVATTVASYTTCPPDMDCSKPCEECVMDAAVHAVNLLRRDAS